MIKSLQSFFHFTLGGDLIDQAAFSNLKPGDRLVGVRIMHVNEAVLPLYEGPTAFHGETIPGGIGDEHIEFVKGFGIVDEMGIPILSLCHHDACIEPATS